VLATVTSVVTGLAIGFNVPADAAPTRPGVALATSNPTPKAGVRQGATRLPFSVSGTASLSVDVGSGNALLTDQLITLPGVRNDVPISLSWNSSAWGSSEPSAVTNSTGSGWVITGFDQRMVTNADNSVTYYGAAGLSGVFTPSGTNFVSPSQFQATLTGSKTAGYTLTDHRSQDKSSFNTSGRLSKITDRDGNVTSFAYDTNGYPASVTSSRGPSAGRTLTVTISGGRITKLAQTSGSLTRSVSIGYSSLGNLASITDTAGGVLSFSSNDEGSSTGGSDTGQVKQITSPRGKSTWLAYTASNQVSSVSQVNPPIDGGAGESVTRLTYPSSAQTLVADPTTNQSQAVSTVPHTTYTINSAQLVSTALDPDGNSRSATYTTIGSLSTATNAAGGQTSFSYGANSGESLTSMLNPGGATESAGYSNTGGAAYLPSSVSNDGGASLKYTYDSNGNQTGTGQGASGPTASVTYNANGTAATSASPGASQHASYTYDSNADLSSITAPTASSLGQRNYTYDGFGRLATATDGKGDTTSYTYDNLDRITKVSYSDGTTAVSYSYDKNGHVTQRIDGSGTTTYSYDDLEHLLSTKNSANGNQVSYTYNLDGSLATVQDGLGSTSYGYDSARQLTSMTFPQAGSTATTYFANNGNGQRTDVWMQSNSGHTSWSAHQQYKYDSSGRVTEVIGQNGPASAPATVLDQKLCYAAGVSPQSCTGTATSADRTNVQASYESVSGETQTYTYDDHDRLTKDVVTGGSNPRTYTYGYDVAGNRTSSSVTGSSPSSQTLTYNAGNQISSSGYSYDGAGNLTTSPTRTATFNAAGQQTSATVSGVKTTYSYAGTGQNETLSQNIPNDRTYSYTYGRPDQNGSPVIDSVTAAGVGTGYILSDPSGQPIMLSTSTGNAVLFINDGQHNPVLLLANNATSQAFSYEPYGKATNTNNTGFASTYENPYTFAGGFRDRATNEVRFGARYYSPVTGGWTQQDTLNAPLDPSNANRYQYSASNPIDRFDPTGEWSWTDFGGAIFGGAAGGCAAGAVGSIWTGPGALAGCGIGAATGAVGGAVTYGATQLWDWIT
jgi:RHS repeat-associated protein